MPRPPALLLLGVLLVLAGCSLPTGPATPTPDRVAPGIAATGRANASALAAANDRTLREGFTLHRNYTDRIPARGDYRMHHETTVRVGPDFERFHRVVHTRARRNGSVAYTTETWSNGSVVFTRFANATATRYERHDAARFPYGPGDLTHAGDVRDLPDGNVTRLDGGRYRLTFAARGVGPRDATRRGAAVFDATGRVFAIDRDAAFDSRVGRAHVSVTVRWTDRGATTVPRPAWYAAAANATQSR
ncbi:MAG: hypothetical protein ABEJ23_02945 [Haloarculaceae archaeon]